MRLFLWRKTMKKNLILSVLLLFAKVVWSDVLFLDVKDKITEKPVVSAMVNIDNKIYFSNDNGKLMIKGIKSGNHKLKIKRIGYKQKIVYFNFPKKNNLIIFLTPDPKELHGIVINQSWADDKTTPVTFENLSATDIEKKDFGLDPNLLISDITNVYSYTESGSGLGYSHLKVRGFDEKRIGVMVNGIPLNDPEDHQVYWVDIPDIGENAQNVQLQRGVGNLTYGISAFGGSLNIETQKFYLSNKYNLSLMYGSYNTRKITFGINRKLYKNFSLNARVSLLKSDGYRIHSKTDMKSFFLSLSKLGNRSAYNINLYGGKELTDASWYASPEDELKKNHRYNPKTYPNEIDDFTQPHLEFHHTYFLSDNTKLNNTLFYIYGNGYYKQLKRGRNPWEYSLTENQNDTLTVDLVRRKNVVKNQSGWIFSLNKKLENHNLTVGSYLSDYKGNHWGEVDSVSVDTLDFYKGKKYYKYNASKYYYSFYLQDKMTLYKKFHLMFNFQNMNILYHLKQNPVGNFRGELLNAYTVKYHFLNTSLGISFTPRKRSQFYLNIARQSREPADNELFDLWNGPDDIGKTPLFAQSDTVYADNGEIAYIKWQKPFVKPETLIDFELGSRLKTEFADINFNVFYMMFNDEIVPYGGADEEGNPIRGNADKTIHRGIELSFHTHSFYNFKMIGNVAYNENYYKKFILHTWDENWNPITKDYSGKKIAGFPSTIAKYSLIYNLNNLKLIGEINWYGKQYLDNENLESRIISSYYLLNANMIYNLPKYKYLSSAKLNLKLNNILNKKYETAGYYDDWEGKNYYWPGAEFNMYLGMKVSY